MIVEKINHTRHGGDVYGDVDTCDVTHPAPDADVWMEHIVGAIINNNYEYLFEATIVHFAITNASIAHCWCKFAILLCIGRCVMWQAERIINDILLLLLVNKIVFRMSWNWFSERFIFVLTS